MPGHKARELFDFAVDYLTNKGCDNWDHSYYNISGEGKFISLGYNERTGNLHIKLANEEKYKGKESAVLELSDRSQIATVLDMLLFAIEKDE